MISLLIRKGELQWAHIGCAMRMTRAEITSSLFSGSFHPAMGSSLERVQVPRRLGLVFPTTSDPTAGKELCSLAIVIPKRCMTSERSL